MSCLTGPAGADPPDRKGSTIMTNQQQRVGGVDSHKDTIQARSSFLPWAARGRLLWSASDRRAVLSRDPELAEHLRESVRIRRR